MVSSRWLHASMIAYIQDECVVSHICPHHMSNHARWNEHKHVLMHVWQKDNVIGYTSSMCAHVAGGNYRMLGVSLTSPAQPWPSSVSTWPSIGATKRELSWGLGTLYRSGCTRCLMRFLCMTCNCTCIHGEVKITARPCSKCANGCILV